MSRTKLLLLAVHPVLNFPHEWYSCVISESNSHADQGVLFFSKSEKNSRFLLRSSVSLLCTWTLLWLWKSIALFVFSVRNLSENFVTTYLRALVSSAVYQARRKVCWNLFFQVCESQGHPLLALVTLLFTTEWVTGRRFFMDFAEFWVQLYSPFLHGFEPTNQLSEVSEVFSCWSVFGLPWKTIEETSGTISSAWVDTPVCPADCESCEFDYVGHHTEHAQTAVRWSTCHEVHGFSFGKAKKQLPANPMFAASTW